MNAKHGVHREALEQPILDHRNRAAHDLFGRLEDQVDGAIEGPRARQVLGRAQQHRAVTVVATGVGLALDGAFVIAVDHLLHCQRIRVGAQTDRPGAVATTHAGDDPRLPDPLGDFVTPLAKQAGDVAGGVLFVERDFRVAVHVMAPGLHLFLIG